MERLRIIWHAMNKYDTTNLPMGEVKLVTGTEWSKIWEPRNHLEIYYCIWRDEIEVVRINLGIRLLCVRVTILSNIRPFGYH